MSRRRVAFVVAFYFVVALAFGAVEKLTAPLALKTLNQENAAYFVGSIIGAAFALYALSGIPPLMGWAFGRFRSQYAGTALFFWALLGIVLGVMMHVGAQPDSAVQIGASATKPFIAGRDRDQFLEGSMSQCLKEQHQSDANRRAGVTDRQMQAYCSCNSRQMADSITVEEMRYLVAEGGKIPATLQQRIYQFASICGRSALAPNTK